MYTLYTQLKHLLCVLMGQDISTISTQCSMVALEI